MIISISIQMRHSYFIMVEIMKNNKLRLIIKIEDIKY